VARKSLARAVAQAAPSDFAAAMAATGSSAGSMGDAVNTLPTTNTTGESVSSSCLRDGTISNRPSTRFKREDKLDNRHRSSTNTMLEACFRNHRNKAKRTCNRDTNPYQSNSLSRAPAIDPSGIGASLRISA
jgi:hypothetical protein